MGITWKRKQKSTIAMGITIDFLIKHLRPIGSGYEAYCTKEMIHCLVDHLHFTPEEVALVFDDWRKVSQLDAVRDFDQFIEAAGLVAKSRWDDLYPDNESTFMFLSAEQLLSLSLAGKEAGPEAEFAWNAPSPISICVTIEPHTRISNIVWDASGCDATTDANGSVVRFRSIRP